MPVTETGEHQPGAEFMHALEDLCGVLGILHDHRFGQLDLQGSAR
jgi:hypothetical protein